MSKTHFNAVPESNRMIELTCSDFRGNYKVTGMFIDYKKPPFKNKKIKSRFCTFNEITEKYESNQNEWKNRDSWQYADTKGQK